MNSTDDDLAELLTLNRAVDTMGIIRYRNSAGQLHRTGGPAVEYSDGSKEWFHHGTLHRDDGPAVEWADGECEWYLNGKCFNGEAEYTAQLVLLSLPSKR